MRVTAPSVDRGLVFDVKRFALHDGPGIRTTAFLKGCPLSCPWCQNPEGIGPARGIWYTSARCIGCGACVASCPAGALSNREGRGHSIRIDRAVCSLNGACTTACPTGAIAWDSREYGVKELVDLFEQDRVFYETSGGGVTLSGGEPLFQARFALAVLRESKGRSLHTALETTAFTSRAVLESVLPFVDHFLVDIKLRDRGLHMKTVGVDNEPILDNISFLAETGATMTVRIPLIPGITAVDYNISTTAAFVASLPGDVPLELINFNPLASGKYLALEQEYEFASRTAPLRDGEIAHFAEVARSQGVHVV